MTMETSAASTGATARLARFVSETSYADIPPEATATVRWALLDTIGVTAAGVRTPVAEAVASMAEAYAGPPIATLVGRRLRCDPASAALVNGATGHALGYDDQSWSMGGHPSVVLWPAILGLSEARGTSGRELIRAYAVGFEAASVVGSTVNPDHYGHGWHTTATVGAVASACAAAAILGLDERRTAHAIAIGASHAGGLRQQFGTDVKPLHAGNAARAGVVAAELAARGVEGSTEILEGRWGFANVFRPAATSTEPPDSSLGDLWRLLDPGIATKVFPSCGATHPGIGAMLELRSRGLRPGDVRRVEARVVDMTARILEHPRPRDGLEAKFSMEYCLARALVSGSVDLDHFDAAAVRDADVRRLVERSHMEVDPRLTADWVWGTPRPTELTVELESGETMVARADLPPGSPGNFPREQLDRKLADCLRRTPPAGSPDEIASVVDRLEDVDDVRELTALLAGPE
jgi:2-methylcitrate dehydratase PrpD